MLPDTLYIPLHTRIENIQLEFLLGNPNPDFLQMYNVDLKLLKM